MSLTELAEWLKQQSDGLSTHHTFVRMGTDELKARTEMAAALRLLVLLSERFSERYDAMPLPADLAHRARMRLVHLTEEAAAAERSSPAEQLALLNKLARADLDDRSGTTDHAMARG